MQKSRKVQNLILRRGVFPYKNLKYVALILGAGNLAMRKLDGGWKIGDTFYSVNKHYTALKPSSLFRLWLKDLNVSFDTVKLLDRNTGKTFISHKL